MQNVDDSRALKHRNPAFDGGFAYADFACDVGVVEHRARSSRDGGHELREHQAIGRNELVYVAFEISAHIRRVEILPVPLHVVQLWVRPFVNDFPNAFVG